MQRMQLYIRLFFCIHNYWVVVDFGLVCFLAHIIYSFRKAAKPASQQGVPYSSVYIALFLFHSSLDADALVDRYSIKVRCDL